VRVFLDTNVLVSAFASRGLCADLLELVLLEHDLIVGKNVLRELVRALRDKVKLPAARSTEIADFVSGEAALVVGKVEPATAMVDSDDALVLAEALAGQAELFVTGDAALLKLATLEGLKLVSPRQFWEALHADSR
jgi:putative PIN family toxin of toxin-antitoxin system